MRLYLLDLPGRSSARILALALVAPEDRFETSQHGLLSFVTPPRFVVSVRPSVVRVMTVPLASTGNPCSGADSYYAMGM
jgi:hypothetical protein